MPAFIHVIDDQGMMFFLNRDLAFDIPEIDADHARLFKLIDGLNRDLEFKTYTQKEIDALFDKLLSYAKGHFAHEEHLFKLMCYEYSAEHIAEHEKMISVIEKLARNNVKMIVVLEFLTKWLNDHLLVHDKKYVEPLKAYIASLNL